MLEEFSTQTAGRKLFSFPEIYIISVKAFRSMGPFRNAAEKGLVSAQLRERIMLAVTAVNGCEVCSYFHTGEALKAGLDNSEIRAFISGEFPDIPEDEAAAVLFAQYYADKRGKVEKETWQSLVDRYGTEKACAVLAAARVIMFGNAAGIPFSSLRGRFRDRKKDSRSTLFYELSFAVLCLPLFIAAGLHALLAGVLRRPLLVFEQAEAGA